MRGSALNIEACRLLISRRNMNIGFFLKKIRTEKKYTLKDVATRLNLTSSLLSQIENGKAHPSLNSLEALLRYYKVNISDFFKQVEQKEYIFVARQDVETLDSSNIGIKVKLLASKLINNVLETYLIEMNPNSKIAVEYTEKYFNGERVLYMLEGTANVVLSEASMTVKTGDSLNFKSHMPCEVINNSDSEGCAFLITGTPPLFCHLV